MKKIYYEQKGWWLKSWRSLSDMKSAKGSYHGPTCAEDSWKQTYLDENPQSQKEEALSLQVLNSPVWFFMNTGCREQEQCVRHTKQPKQGLYNLRQHFSSRGTENPARVTRSGSVTDNTAPESLSHSREMSWTPAGHTAHRHYTRNSH